MAVVCAAAAAASLSLIHPVSESIAVCVEVLSAAEVSVEAAAIVGLACGIGSSSVANRSEASMDLKRDSCQHLVQIEDRYERVRNGVRIVFLSRWCHDCASVTWQHQAKNGRTSFFWSLALEEKKRRAREQQP